MRICIFGAGAIGSWLGARLAASGADVTLIARGPHLEAIRSGGLVVREGQEERTFRLATSERASDVGPQDIVFVTLKAQAAASAAPAIAALLHHETTVIPAVNGLPWWYFWRHGGPFDDHRLESVDPDGEQWRHIGPERVVGCVVHPAVEMTAPGRVEHREGLRLSLGEPDRQPSRRSREVAAILGAAGLRAPLRRNLRHEIWLKLTGNLAFNPVSALTGASLGRIAADAGCRDIVRRMMLEARDVARDLGIELRLSVAQRIAGAARVGDHKTSMLQDLERGRPLEIDALLGSVQEVAGWVRRPIPMIDAVAALVTLRARGAES